MRLLLIRHGQTPGNVAGLIDTAHPGPGLTDLGHRQAAHIPVELKNEPVDALFASTLVRTQLTAIPLSTDRRLDIDVRPGLHEIQAGSLEDRRDHEAVRAYLETVFAWVAGDRDVAMPDGPDGHEFFGRYNTDLRAIEASGASSAAVVSHGAAIRVWVAANVTNVSPVFAQENHLDNAGIVVVEGSFERGWTLSSWAGRSIADHGEPGTPLVTPPRPDVHDPTGETLSEARADSD